MLPPGIFHPLKFYHGSNRPPDFGRQPTKRSRWFKSLPGFQKFRPSSRASGKFWADSEENFLSVVETKGNEILQYLVCIFQLDNNDQRTKHEFFRT